MKMISDLKHMCEILEDELSNVNKKLDKGGGTLSGDDISYIDKLTHALKSIKTTIAMIEAEEQGSYADGSYRGNSYAMYPHMGSYARGRSNPRRDSMGRYSSRGYSRDHEMISELRELMEESPDERTRQEFQRFISKIEQMG